MPTYLLHGFRWPRSLVRIHIILQNIDDAAAEWLVAPKTTLSLLKNFNELYPECMEHLPRLRFVEQYDPTDLASTAVSQPFAYVADLVEEVKLGVDIDEVRGRGLNNEQWTAIMELRDKLAPEENVGWYIVVCGDEERLFPPTSDSVQGSANSRSVTPEKPNEPPVKAAVATGTDSPGGKLHKQKPQTPPEKDKGESKGLLGKLLGSARLKRPKR